MTEADQQRGRIRRLVGRVAPGVEAFSHYRIAWLSGDVAAGLSVAAVALPVGIAYADLAGVPAVIGMYAAIFPLFAYALFGSSRQLMVGPAAATCMMMAAALLTPADVLLAVSHSGSTRDTVETAKTAKNAGARVICITNNSLSPLTKTADLVLVTASRETRFRQEAMASRLCQTSIIDSLYTLVALTRPEEALQNLAKIENVIVTKQY